MGENYGTMEKLWYFTENLLWKKYGTMDKTMVLK